MLRNIFSSRSSSVSWTFTVAFRLYCCPGITQWLLHQRKTAEKSANIRNDNEDSHIPAEGCFIIFFIRVWLFLLPALNTIVVQLFLKAVCSSRVYKYTMPFIQLIKVEPKFLQHSSENLSKEIDQFNRWPVFHRILIAFSMNRLAENLLMECS